MRTDAPPSVGATVCTWTPLISRSRFRRSAGRISFFSVMSSSARTSTRNGSCSSRRSVRVDVTTIGVTVAACSARPAVAVVSSPARMVRTRVSGRKPSLATTTVSLPAGSRSTASPLVSVRAPACPDRTTTSASASVSCRTRSRSVAVRTLPVVSCAPIVRGLDPAAAQPTAKVTMERSRIPS